MNFMQRTGVVFSLVTMMIAMAGCSDAESMRPDSPEVLLEENACAIRCPLNTGNAYAGVSGSVRCRDIASPVCQCSDDTKPMGACEPIEQ